MTLEKKPKIVCLGGGTGLPVVLRSLAGLGERVAIVNMVDDGRSSGILRKRYKIPPVGDLRNSLIELATNRELADLLKFRFNYGPLSPHPVGNIMMAAYLLSNNNSLKKLVNFFSKTLSIDGKVLPMCDEVVELVGQTRKNNIVRGQVRVSRTRGIKKVWLEPQVEANREAVVELEKADYLVIAPGSLYSSILPVLITPGIKEKFLDSKAIKIWVFNVANEKNETFMYRAKDYIRAMKTHLGDFKVDFVLFSKAPKAFSKPYRLVKLDIKELEGIARQVIIEDLANEKEPGTHDALKLKVVFEQIFGRTREN